MYQTVLASEDVEKETCSLEVNAKYISCMLLGITKRREWTQRDYVCTGQDGHTSQVL